MSDTSTNVLDQLRKRLEQVERENCAHVRHVLALRAQLEESERQRAHLISALKDMWCLWQRALGRDVSQLESERS